MMHLRETLDDALSGTTVPHAKFQAAVVRLMDRGVICRGDSVVETEIYDNIERIERILDDYFSLAGFRMRLDRVHQYVRLYPPKAAIPGEPLAEDDEGLYPGARMRLSPDVAAAAITLRFLYSQALQSGKLDDDGEAETSLEAVITAMETQLKREFPRSLMERKELMRQLRAIKLVRFIPDELFEVPDAALMIRPMIIGLVHEAALDAVLLDGATDVEQVEPEEASDASL